MHIYSNKNHMDLCLQVSGDLCICGRLEYDLLLLEFFGRLEYDYRLNFSVS